VGMVTSMARTRVSGVGLQQQIANCGFWFGKKNLIYRVSKCRRFSHYKKGVVLIKSKTASF